MLDPLFWPTVATVLPVLALAIVVEARTSITRWTDNNPPRWLRTIQSILWIIPLVLFVYLEPVAFQRLEGSKPSHFSVSLVVPTVALSLSVLIVNPATELLVRSNARIIARTILVLSTTPVRWKFNWGIRRARRLLHKINVLQSDVLADSAMLYSYEHEARSLTDVGRRDQILAKVADARNHITERRKLLKDSEQEVGNILKEALHTRQKFGRAIRSPEVIAQFETALTQMDFRTNASEKALEKALEKAMSEEDSTT